MPYIPLKENLQGITGLLDFRLDTALPIRQLTQILLRAESTLTEGERELIAAVTSYRNECRFCTAAHTAATDLYLGNPAIAEAATEEPAFYDRLGHILLDKGYLRSPDRYTTL